MNWLLLAAGSVLTVCAQVSPPQTTVVAPTAETVVIPPVSPSVAPVRIAATTLVDIELVEPLSSRTAVMDAMFPIRLAEPLMDGDRVLLPAGTPGMGQVVHAAKSGGGGRAGELLLAARYLEVNGVRIPLRRFRLGTSGAQRSDAAFAVGSVVPFGQLLVKGKEVEYAAGTRANALVAADTEIATGAAVDAAATPEDSQKGE